MNAVNFQIEQIKTEIHDIYKAYRFSHLGLHYLRDKFKEFQSSNGIENFRIEDVQCEIDLKFSDKDVEEATDNGYYQTIMAGNIIITIYNLWEDNYRNVIAKSLNLNSKNDLKDDFFGDLGKIRNSIVHNHFKRSSEIDKLKVLGYLFKDDKFLLDYITVHEIHNKAMLYLDNLKQP